MYVCHRGGGGTLCVFVVCVGHRSMALHFAHAQCAPHFWHQACVATLCCVRNRCAADAFTLPPKKEVMAKRVVVVTCLMAAKVRVCAHACVRVYCALMHVFVCTWVRAYTHMNVCYCAGRGSLLCAGKLCLN